MGQKSCQITGQDFQVAADEAAFLESFDLPLPAICPAERQRRRLAFSSSGRFHWRLCDATGKKIFSIYPQEASFPVVAAEYWFSDAWNPLAPGVDFNFTRSFFEQFHELWTQIPRPAVSNSQPGCTACYQCSNTPDSFMLFNVVASAGCCYSAGLFESRQCIDCYYAVGCERCYECVECMDCKNVRWGECCLGCRDSSFISYCTDCRSCLFCTGLQGKEYHVFNRPVPPAEYEQIQRDWNFGARQKIEEAKETFTEFLRDKPIPHIFASPAAGATGNYLYRCCNAVNSFECVDCRDILYCTWLSGASQCLEGLGFSGNLERCAQFVGLSGTASNIINCIDCGGEINGLAYCSHCFDSSNLFACIGLRGRENCIMNKQFSSKKYLEERERIVKHLKVRGVWGKFFPPAFSGYAYNRSAASDLMPLAKIPAQMMGFSWDESDEFLKPSLLRRGDGQPEVSFADIPEMVGELTDDLARQAVFLCEMSGRPFRYTREECEFYRQAGIAPPARSPEERYRERLMKLPPRTLVSRTCAATGVALESSYPENWRRPVEDYRVWSDPAEE